MLLAVTSAGSLQKGQSSSLEERAPSPFMQELSTLMCEPRQQIKGHTENPQTLRASCPVGMPQGHEGLVLGASSPDTRLPAVELVTVPGLRLESASGEGAAC